MMTTPFLERKRPGNISSGSGRITKAALQDLTEKKLRDYVEMKELSSYNAEEQGSRRFTLN